MTAKKKAISQSKKRPTSKNLLMFFKWLWNIKEKWYLALINIPLTVLFVLFAYTLVNVLTREGETKTLLLGLIPGAFLASIVKDFVVSLINSDGQAVKRVVKALGQMSILVCLVVVDIPLGVGYRQVTNPCYGIPHNDLTDPTNPKVIVLIANFQLVGTDKNPVASWPIQLRNELSDELSKQNILIKDIPSSVVVDSDSIAETQNDCYGAYVTIWGYSGDNILEIHYSSNVLLNNTKLWPTEMYMRGSDTSNSQVKSENVVPMASFKATIDSAGNIPYLLSLFTGWIQAAKGNSQGAISQFQVAEKLGDVTRALKMRMDCVYLGLSLNYRILGDIQQALVYAEKTVKLKPDWIWGYDARSEAFWYRKEYQKALDDLNKIISMSSQTSEFTLYDLGRWYVNRGIIKEHLGDFSGALSDFEQAIRYSPNDPYIYANRARAYESLLKFDQAITDYTKALDIGFPDKARVYVFKGKDQCVLGNLGPALADLRTGYSLDKTLTQGFFDCGKLLAVSGRNADAITFLNEAVTVAPNNGSYVNELGMALVGIGDTQKALEKFDLAIKLDPTLWEPRFNRASALDMLKRYKESLSAYQAYIDWDKGNVNPTMYIMAVKKVAELKKQLNIP